MSSKEMGVTRYQVDATQFDPVALKVERHRADASERMKHAHEAAAYDKWFRAKVQASLDDPRPSIPHDQVMAEMDAIIAEAEQRHRKQA